MDLFQVVILFFGTVRLNIADLKCQISHHENRFDCHPEPGANERACQSRGCCWRPQDRLPGQPLCFFPTGAPSYNVIQWQDVDYGHEASLYGYSPYSWPNVITNLTLKIWYETKTRIHFKIYDHKHGRYEVPIDMPPVPRVKSSETDFIVEYNSSPFGLRIKRKSTGTSLFDTISPTAPLIYTDQFLQITTLLTSRSVFGVGERLGPLFINASTWTKQIVWSRDQPPMTDTNLYGAHPFYINLETDGNAHGIFFLNSNAMEFIFQSDPALTLRTIGGVLDFYIYSGPGPEDVVKQYVQSIGLPVLPPYWALGFHLCRYNYGSLDKMKMIAKRNRDLGIPYEVQWADIDYMDEKKIWTYDKNKFAGLPEFVADLHRHHQKFIPIVDPGVGKSTSNYPPYDRGLEMEVFIKNATGDVLEGKVWPGLTVFPDFTNPNTTKWWHLDAHEFHNIMPYDGLWIDMNEPANFLDGSTSGCTDNHLDRPRYYPGLNKDEPLAYKTLCPSAQQHLSTHYNLHSLYGHFEAKATYQTLKNITNKRPFVLSRSTFAGTGKYSHHWTGDVQSSWDDLYYSVPSILNFQFFGIPFVGADVCGFRDDTTEELCIRWMQLGAFYPFMRNHNDDHSIDQDPAAFSLEAQRIMKSALELRYSFLPFFYTQLFLSHTTGAPVIKPLFFFSPNELETHSIDKQFVWGNSLLITPVLDQGATRVRGYFDSNFWYDLYTGRVLKSCGRYYDLDAPLGKINVHLRGGSVVPRKDPTQTIFEASDKPYKLLIGLDEQNKATGQLFLDDGESLDVVENGLYSLVNFKVENDELVSVIVASGYVPSEEKNLSEVTIFGVHTRPSVVFANGVTVKFTYNEAAKVLQISALNLNILKTININWQLQDPELTHNNSGTML